MQEFHYLSNVIASKDINELSAEQISSTSEPHLVFSIEQICGDHECVAVARNALNYAATTRIDDTDLFSNALIEYSQTGHETFFEFDYNDFISAYPFAPAADIIRIGILVVPSIDGYRFQTLTLLDDGSLMHDPYYMFLPTAAIDAARIEQDPALYPHRIFEAMEVEFPDKIPPEGSQLEREIEKALPVSATIATIGISLLALKSEAEAASETPLPVIQKEESLPTIVSLALN